MYIGFVLAFMALISLSNAPVLEKYLISNNLSPVLLAATSMFIASGILFSLIFLFKIFNVEILGNLSFKNIFSSMMVTPRFLVVFLVLCCICATTKLCIFSSLKFISPFQLNLVLSLMPVTVLVFSSIMSFDSLTLKTFVSLILCLCAIAIQIFL